jgi:hypothetical protein
MQPSSRVNAMTLEEDARQEIDRLLDAAGWQVQDYKNLNLADSPISCLLKLEKLQLQRELLSKSQTLIIPSHDAEIADGHQEL